MVFNQPGVAVMKCRYTPSDNNAAAAPGPLFTKRTDVLPQDLGKSRSRKIRVWTFLVALTGTSAAALSNFKAIRPLEYPVSRLPHFPRFCGKTSLRLVNRSPGLLCGLISQTQWNANYDIIMGIVWICMQRLFIRHVAQIIQWFKKQTNKKNRR